MNTNSACQNTKARVFFSGLLQGDKTLSNKQKPGLCQYSTSCTLQTYLHIHTKILISAEKFNELIIEKQK